MIVAPAYVTEGQPVFLIISCLVVGVTLAALVQRRARRKGRVQLAAPLAGYDTGVRSPWRTPQRFFKPHKGF